ncbi:MAG: energy transducer TonB [Candidatus Neomarinimicrobiota bacterium]|jgi:protein TonB|nr:energy transducer TonB [Candidatus Neomarinimicrobiota bacterium]HJN68292.1 energy transducer TonB [Candidatus Neomarinimicrobiota bacterium]|tara:strand:- start:9968 stop:10588 length:621 start_codon:yes stop_codon:yes gene_type:complete
MSLEQLSLKLRFPFIIRATGLLSIILSISLFFILPRFTGETVQEHYDQIIIEQIDIPQTQQIERPPPPARPSIPIESEDEDLADDLTIEETDLSDFEAWDAPPPPPSGPQVKFIPYDDPPVPLTPIRPKYPEIAQEAGIEGTVFIQAFIDKKGRVIETTIIKGIPNTGLDEAAIEAIRKTRFRPAKQRERAVGVWISIPVNFKLKG